MENINNINIVFQEIKKVVVNLCMLTTPKFFKILPFVLTIITWKAYLITKLSIETLIGMYLQYSLYQLDKHKIELDLGLDYLT